MTLLYIPHLILAGLVGVHSEIFSVSKVPVKAGESITIPCRYELRHRDHVKYLCKGTYWRSCSYIVKTNQPHHSGIFSISDDKKETIFTVTIHNVTDENTYYWCAVEISAWPDVKQRFQLSVTTGKPSLYVDHQEITAFERGSVTVMCYYQYPDVKKWCRLGSTCVSDQGGSLQGAAVTINASVPNVFTVVMSELRTGSSGWYWCTNGDLQMPVHITVHEITSTTTTTLIPSTTNFIGMFSTTTHNSSLSAEPQTAWPTNSITNSAGTGSVQDKHEGSTKVTILITTLILNLLIVPAVFFGWKAMRRNKTKPEGPNIAEGLQSGTDPDVLYTTISHNQHAATQKNHTPEESVTYSTIVIKDSVSPEMEPADRSVIYNTLQASKCERAERTGR